LDFPFETEVTDEAGTIEVARRFSESLQEGDIITLVGNLGSGKTFFVKQVSSNFGINNASSPSFAIVNRYENSKTINHFDFYRLKREEELYDLGFEEYVFDENVITFIEWADLMPAIIPRKKIQVTFEITGNVKRKIKIEKYE